MPLSTQIPHEMKIVYIQRRIADLAECNKAIESGDFSFLEKIGHQVKGNAQSFGFDALSPLGIALETAAKSRDIPTLRKVVDDFTHAVEHIQKTEM
ncbi:MAG: Hpt domain-containing protein [Bdellovibrionaceae bacterium]|nr:Hpt domain-containing protein [Pseudobdellovibrionaceae bacterium]